MSKRPRSPSSTATRDQSDDVTHVLNNLLQQFPYMSMHRQQLKQRSAVQLAALADTMRQVERINAGAADDR